MGNIKVDKRNETQMEIHKKIIVDATRNIINNPSLKITEEIKNATDYYTKNNPVQVMLPESLVEWVTTLKNVIDNDGIWYLKREREFAREVIIKDAYYDLTGKKVNVIKEDGPKPGQISVEDVCPLEAPLQDKDELTPEELEENNKPEEHEPAEHDSVAHNPLVEGAPAYFVDRTDDVICQRIADVATQAISALLEIHKRGRD